MINVTLKIYLIANLLIVVFFIFLSNFDSELLLELFAVLISSLIISLPCLFFLIMSFRSLKNLRFKPLYSWLAISFFILMIAAFPWIFFLVYLGAPANDDELIFLLYLGEGSAFAAVILQCLPINRLFKTFNYETKQELIAD